ncbi:DUF6985 domain-containing protein [Steroidobacter flavus]|uniref:DUF6985 domain-containing protein n=1 Tax=Steroidobacter flavus TaxID=1842136 RepID=A0ABV8SSH5_9GAMM
MNPIPTDLVFPWVLTRVPVKWDPEDAIGGEEAALQNIPRWTDGLRIAIERACFADYLQKIDDIAAEPPTVPVIKSPSQVWSHIELQSVRPFGPDIVVVYAVPAWDENLHHEWCVEGTDTLLYVGQFLGYSGDGYRSLQHGNAAVSYEETIARLGHLPQSWVTDSD